MLTLVVNYADSLYCQDADEMLYGNLITFCIRSLNYVNKKYRKQKIALNDHKYTDI